MADTSVVSVLPDPSNFEGSNIFAAYGPNTAPTIIAGTAVIVSRAPTPQLFSSTASKVQHTSLPQEQSPLDEVGKEGEESHEPAQPREHNVELTNP